MAFGYPAQDEERGLGVVAVEQLQDTVGIAFYPRRELVPVIAIDDRFEGGYLKMLLDVDAHGADGIRWSGLLSRHSVGAEEVLLR